MSGNDSDGKKRSLLSDALRAVREIRPVQTQDLADALGLSVRGYQNFEAGGGQLNINHVMRFSRRIDCDPIGVLASVQIGKPEFAAYVAQNKAMLAYMIQLQEFVEEAGEAIASLETTTWVSAYRAMFKDLAEKALAAKAAKDAWVADNSARLGLAGDPPVVPGAGDPAQPQNENDGESAGNSSDDDPPS